MGEPTRSGRIRSWLSTAGDRGTGRSPEPEQDRDGCIPLTSNLTWADAPGNVLLPSKLLGLPKDSVANASQIVAVDREFLGERCGRLPPKKLALVMNGIDVMLGR